MRKALIGLILAATAMVPAAAQAQNWRDGEGGRHDRGETHAARVQERQAQQQAPQQVQQQAPQQVVVRQRGDGGNRGNWQGRGDGGNRNWQGRNEAQVRNDGGNRSNWQGRNDGGNRGGWQGRNWMIWNTCY